MLDEDTREAARKLAARYGCSTSEAIRKAVIAHQNTVFGLSEDARRARDEAFDRMCELFEGVDPEEEVRRIKEEDEGF